MKKYAFAFMSFFLVTLAKAQSPTFTLSNGTFSYLSGATPVMKDSVWDDPELWKTADRTINLGFTFNAFGKSITAFRWEQGGISYKQVDTVVYIGYQDIDMCDLGYGTKNAMSPLSMKTEGSSGNLIVKLQFRRFGIWDDWNSNGSFSDSGEMQIWIYQNPQKIELHFGKSTITDVTGYYSDGIKLVAAKYDDDGRTSGIKLNGQAMNPTVYSFDDTGNRKMQSWPEANTVYVFSFSPASVQQFDGSLSHVFYNGNALIFEPKFNENSLIHIYAADGREVKTEAIRNQSVTTVGLVPGIYMVKSDQFPLGSYRFVVTQ